MTPVFPLYLNNKGTKKVENSLRVRSKEFSDYFYFLNWKE